MRSAPIARNADWHRDAESLSGGLFTPAYGSDPASVNPPYWRHMPVSDTDDALSRLIDSADLIEAAGRTFLLIEATPILMDFLESYGADREDMEDSGDDEPDYDNERDHRLAPKTLPRAKEVDGIVWVGERRAS